MAIMGAVGWQCDELREDFVVGYEEDEERQRTL